MARRVKYSLLLLAALLTLAIWLLWIRGDAAPPWGQGKLRVSERAYYASRINSAINAARVLAGQSGRHNQDEARDSPYVLLVIDTVRKEMWVESNGRVVQEYHTDLPRSMDWKLYRSTPDGTTTELPSLGRFRLPADSKTRLFFPEYVSLVGARGRRESLAFSFSSNDSGQVHSEGPWTPQSVRWPLSPKQVNQDGSYESIILSEGDYEKAKAGFKTTDLTPDEPTRLSENKAAWRRVEKALYQEIERQVSIQGLPLQNLEVTCGPDCSAASAYVFGARGGLAIFHHGPSSASVYLCIDYLGDDVWYARSAPHPLQRATGPIRLDLEFLVSAEGPIASERRPSLLAEGRRRQQASTSTSKWRVNLPNGVTIEFIGVCENPSGGKQWWGPDGSPLGYRPYFNDERCVQVQADGPVYEIVYRVSFPACKRSGVRQQGFFEISHVRIQNRYGNVGPDPELHAAGYTFGGSTKKATLWLGTHVDDGQYAWATFKNISLVRGEDQGFEIVEGQGPE
jgi:hypothetical protein